MPARARSPLFRWAMALTVASLVVLPGAPASSEPRLPVTCCDFTGTFDVSFTVKLDPANHNAVIRLTGGTVVVSRLTSGQYEIRGNRSEIIRASGGRTDCSLPLATGRGTVAGFPNVDGRYKDVVVTGDGIEGLLELGTGGELPTGQAVCYNFTGQRDPDVPDPGAANVNFDPRFALRIAARFEPRSTRGLERIDSDTIVVGRHVLTNDGTGGFTPTQELPLSREPLSVNVAQLNGDAFADIAVLTTNPEAGDSWMLAFQQTPAGTFTQTANVDLGLDLASISVGDITGDTLTDVVGLDRLGEVQVLRNVGNATFGSTAFLTGVNFVSSAPETVDVDDDGDQDILALGWSTLDPSRFAVKPLLGDGTGDFAVASTETQLSVCAGNTNPFQINWDIGDFNGDGLTDAAVVNAGGGACPGSPSTVTVLLNRPAAPGTFTALPPFEIPDGHDGGVQIRTLMAPCAGTPALIANGRIFVGLGDGRFEDSGVSLSDLGFAPAALATGDVTGDELKEIAAVFFEEEDTPVVRIHSITAFAERPTISNVAIAGKTLAVEGTGFPTGSKILVDGVEYKTKADRASPTTTLFSKKALKKIDSGRHVVQVRTPTGVVTEGFVFEKP